MLLCFTNVDLSSSVRMALIGDITSVVHSTNEQQLSNILRSLAKLDARWSDLPDKLCSTAISALSVKLKSIRHVSTVLFAFGQLGANWFDFPSEFTKTILNTLLSHSFLSNSKEFSSDSSCKRNHFDKTHESTLVDRASDNMNSQDLAMLLVGLSRMGVTWSSVPDYMLVWCRESIVHLVNDMSGKQLSMVARSLG